MTEWGVVAVIVSLVGLMTAVITPIIKLNTAITKLNVLVEGLREDRKKFDASAAAEHEKLWKQIRDAEKRITELERGTK